MNSLISRHRFNYGLRETYKSLSKLTGYVACLNRLRYLVSPPTLLILLFLVSKCTLASQECVVLLHALGHSKYSMASMATYLKKANYLVVNQSYPSTRKSIKTLADEYLPEMVRTCQQYKPSKIHFVTHSIGGIVLRSYLNNHNVPHLGNIVMLAPPNHGSPLADLLKNSPLFKLLAGPAGQELTTAPSSTPNRLNQLLQYPVGIIAGNFTFNPLMRIIFHDDHDGKVSVTSTRLQGMQDMIVLPVSHLFMTQNKLVMQEVDQFLQQGRFNQTLVIKYMGVFYPKNPAPKTMT